MVPRMSLRHRCTAWGSPDWAIVVTLRCVSEVLHMTDALMPLSEIERMAQDLESVEIAFPLHEPLRRLLATARRAHALREKLTKAQEE